jgi:phosphatidyl-myo-inositol dimannoside synthase
MKIRHIGIYTHDLFPSRERLMPWRTVLEVARGMKNAGIDVTVFNGTSDLSGNSQDWNGVPIKDISKPSRSLAEFLVSQDLDCIFFPVTWRSGETAKSFFSRLSIPILCYFPSGCYKTKDVLRGMTQMSPKGLLPFMLDSIIPKNRLINAMRKGQVRGVLTMTEVTRQALTDAGWPDERSFMIPPGIEAIDSIAHQDTGWNRFDNRFLNRNFLLFMGSSAPIRGGHILLKAFDLLADIYPQIDLICLIREDKGVDPFLFKKMLNSLKHRSRVIVFWDHLNAVEVRGIAKRAYAVVLPFLLIPSEIPLTFLEVLSMGIPVVTTENGGTSEFVKEAAYIAKPGNVKSLSTAMKKLLNDEAIYRKKKKAAKNIMRGHPSWQEVADMWQKAAYRVLAMPSK